MSLGLEILMLTVDKAMTNITPPASCPSFEYKIPDPNHFYTVLDEVPDQGEVSEELISDEEPTTEEISQQIQARQQDRKRVCECTIL